MLLTKKFQETVDERLRSDPKFEIALLEETAKDPMYKVSFIVRCMALSYDIILLICLYICATFLIVMINHSSIPSGNIYYRLFLVLITYLFFTYFWYKYNQTTGMLAWKIKLVGMKGQKPTFAQVSLRFLLAILTNLIFGIGILWALFDKNNLSLYDHFSKTKLIKNT